MIHALTGHLTVPLKCQALCLYQNSTVRLALDTCQVRQIQDQAKQLTKLDQVTKLETCSGKFYKLYTSHTYHIHVTTLAGIEERDERIKILT